MEEKRALELKLKRCRELAREFPDGSTHQMVIDLLEETEDQLRLIEISRKPD
jgi:hypothetical protein